MNIKRLAKSFKYAACGIAEAVRCEQNMRIHISAASLIIPFAYYFGITRCEWAVLFTVIGAVVFAELMNTAVERTADAVTKEKNENIKFAKDAAAGGVVAAAAASVAVGFALFGDWGKILTTLAYISTHAVPAVIFLCILAADTVFLVKIK